MVWTVQVECAFVTDPMATTPTWTDITAYVLEGSIQITRGRPDEFGEVAPSTLSLTLKNFDGRFTMFYTGGAYSPNVKIGKRIRVSVGADSANAVAGDNATFNATVGTWVNDSNAATPVRSTAQFQSSPASMRIESLASGTMTVRHAPAPAATNAVLALPSTSYTASAAFRAATAGRSVQVGINWYQEDGTFITTSFGSTVTDTTTGWVTASLSVTSPSNAGRMIALARVQSTGAAAEQHYVDDVSVSPATYRRFDGHVNDWPTQWPAGRAAYALAPITATDRLKRFGRPGTLRSMLEEEVLRDAPAAYYPLGEPQEATSAASVTPAAQAPATVRAAGGGGTLEFGAGTGPGTDELSAPVFTPLTTVNGPYLAADLTAPAGSTTATTLEVWLRTSNALIVSRRAAELATWSGDRLHLSIDSSGHAIAQAVDDVGGLAYTLTYSGALANDMLTHHVAVTESRSGSTVTARLYVDGVDRGSTTRTATALPAYGRMLIGWAPDNPGGHGVWNGTLAHAAAYSSALSATRLLAHYNAGSNGFSGERTDQRIGRIADWIGIPAADRTFDIGNSTVAAQATSGQQAIEAMREVELTEGGVLFVAGDGELTSHNRARRYNVSPAVTLTAAQLAAPVEFPADDFGLVNDMTVTRAAGAPARAVNDTSITDYGLYRDEAQIVSDTDAATFAMASWRVNNYGDPRTRVPNLTVEIQKLERVASASVAAVLASDISTKWRVTSLPATAPTSQVDVFIEGLTEQIGKKVWTIIYNTSPGDLAAVWALGTAGFGELGTTTKLGQ